MIKTSWFCFNSCLFFVVHRDWIQFILVTATFHCVKNVRIRSYSGPYFPAVGRNAERYGVSLCIKSKCGKMQTRKTPNMDTFDAVFGSGYQMFKFQVPIVITIFAVSDLKPFLRKSISMCSTNILSYVCSAHLRKSFASPEGITI